MPVFSFTSRGNHNKTRDFLKRVINGDVYSGLEVYGQMGVDALASATPVRTGRSADSWGFRVLTGPNPGIEWFNHNRDSTGTPVVILIQYGHGTGTGGYVQGLDFINPAIRPIFDRIADDIWKKVTK